MFHVIFKMKYDAGFSYASHSNRPYKQGLDKSHANHHVVCNRGLGIETQVPQRKRSQAFPLPTIIFRDVHNGEFSAYKD
jgi:hypothetical protein